MQVANEIQELLLLLPAPELAKLCSTLAVMLVRLKCSAEVRESTPDSADEVVILCLAAQLQVHRERALVRALESRLPIDNDQVWRDLLARLQPKTTKDSNHDQ